MIKLLIKFFIFLGGLFLLFLWLYWGNFSDFKKSVKDLTQKVVGKIYQEAEIHNPAGDVLPDGVDDHFKLWIKEFYQKIK